MAPTDADLAALPKVELHVHLEGTVSAATASALARAHGDDPDEVLVLGPPAADGTPRYPAPFLDFDQFVRCFVSTSAQLRTPDDLTAATRAFVAEQRRQRVLWTEATFTATTLTFHGWDTDAMWRAVAAGLEDAPVGLVVDAPRNLGVANARAAVAAAARGLALGLPVVALGLTGPETSAPVHDFAFLRAAADDLGVGLVAHAGETGDAQHVLDSLDIGADRIGHGVALAADPAAMAVVADAGIVCEVCPSSNVGLGVVATMDAHPLPTMVAAGITVAVGSDDPPFFRTTLTDELRHAERLLGLDRAGHAALQRTALAASFAPSDVRATVGAALDAWAAASAGPGG